MNERPILFSGPMVRAILEGRKTQTRRVCKFVPLHDGLNLQANSLQAGLYHTGWKDGPWVLRSMGGACWNDRTKPLRCPYGVPGDRLWVRETIHQSASGVTVYAENGCPAWWHGESVQWPWPKAKVVTRGMPRWASRITLGITNVRVQRVQEISEEDAIAEGMLYHDGGRIGHSGWRHDPNYGCIYNTACEAFATGWICIYSKSGRGWRENPWVWAITFKILEAGR